MLIHHKRLYLTSPHLFCFWLLENGVSFVLLYDSVVHFVLVCYWQLLFLVLKQTHQLTTF